VRRLVSATPKKKVAPEAEVALKEVAKPKRTVKAAPKAAPKPVPKPAPAVASKAAPKLARTTAEPKESAPAEKVAPELALPAVLTLVKIGKAKGNLTQDEIDGALGDIELSEHQVESIYAHFVTSGIEIAEPIVDVSPEDAEMIIEADEVSACTSRRSARCRCSRRPRRSVSRSA
jgi:hypothetical protein